MTASSFTIRGITCSLRNGVSCILITSPPPTLFNPRRQTVKIVTRRHRGGGGNRTPPLYSWKHSSDWLDIWDLYTTQIKSFRLPVQIQRKSERSLSQTVVKHRQTQQTFLTLPEAIENLTLSLCKCQKWKEQVKISKCRKFGDLRLKTVTLGRFLKTKNTPKLKKENVWEFVWDRGWTGIDARPTQNSDAISVKFSAFKNFPNSTIFFINSPNFRLLRTLTCSLHFLHLQSANVRFPIA